MRRGGALARGGAVAVKVSKPGQDLRFDVPAVGPETVAVCREPGIAVLALEAGKTLLLERDALLAAATRRPIWRSSECAPMSGLSRSAPRSSASATSAPSTPRSTPACPASSWSASSTSTATRAAAIAGALGAPAVDDCRGAVRPHRLRQHRRADAGALRGRGRAARARRRRAGREADHRDARRRAAPRRAGRDATGASCRSAISSASTRRSARSPASSPSRASSSAIAWRRSPSAAPTSTSSST